jgi:arylsulfatase A-like enzyme
MMAATGCDDGPNATETLPEAPPNVLVIVIDTLRSDHLSQYGYGLDTSPGLERLTRQGTRFSQARSPAPWTKPSIASLFSGMVPARHGAIGQFKRLPRDVDTLAEILSREGWKTAAFSDNPFITEATYFDQGFDAFHYRRQGKSKRPEDAAPPRKHGDHLFDQTEAMFEQMRAWISAHSEAPFFVYVQPMNVHGPYWVPSKHRAGLFGRPPISGFEYYKGPMNEIMNRGNFALRKRMPPRYLKAQQEMYDTAIRFVTDTIGDLFDYLDETGLYDNTLIVVTSDHGEEMFDHGGFGHAWSLYEEVLDVPLIVKFPGQSRPQIIDDPVSLLDVLPTILSAANIALPERLDGEALQPLIAGEARSEPRDMYFETQWKKRCVARAVREHPWKLIEIKKNYESKELRWLLFDLERDPEEKMNVASRHPDVVSHLRAKLEKRFELYEATSVRAAADLETVDEEALRALGYIE